MCETVINKKTILLLLLPLQHHNTLSFPSLSFIGDDGARGLKGPRGEKGSRGTDGDPGDDGKIGKVGGQGKKGEWSILIQ